MTVELLKGPCLPGICVNDMKDGQIAEIVEWIGSHPVGRIVQRFDSSLVILGQPEGKSFGSIFAGCYCHEGCRVRLLEPGETLRIIDNSGEE